MPRTGCDGLSGDAGRQAAVARGETFYCGELLSLICKISALYSQSLDDPVVLNAVDDIEDLTTELSQKIWQKITLLDLLKSADDRAAEM